MPAYTKRFARLGAAVALFGLAACNDAPPQPPPVQTGPTVQGWTDQDRALWYQATQGSRLVPYAWLNALEQADSDRPFLDDDHIAGFRYIPRGNADGLPFGFAIDKQDDTGLPRTSLRWKSGQGANEPWVGMNCSACHTGDIAWPGTSASGEARRIRIEGGQTIADFQGFMEAFNRAIARTQAEDAKFARFALRVLGAEDNDGNRALLRPALAALVDWQGRQLRANQTELRYGFGRVDAFGHIFNKVALLADENAPGNPASAPVSYPFLWQIDRLPYVQYNGLAANGPTVAGTNAKLDIGAAARNTGEVIGVFADVALRHEAGDLRGFRSSVRLDSLVGLEQVLAKLQPPSWPGETPDSILVARGRDLFQQACASCHTAPGTVTQGRYPFTMSTFSNTVPPAQPGNRPPETDPWMACNAVTYTSASGTLNGLNRLYFAGKPFEQTAHLADMLKFTVIGTMVGHGLVRDLDIVMQTWLGRQQVPQIDSLSPQFQTAPGAFVGTLGAPQPMRETEESRAARLRFCQETPNILLGYKSRPLAGIWATAPYLHNGSVPNLWELLLPAEKRSASFWLGTREYDPVKVGFRTEPTAPGNSFEFRTRDPQGKPIPGNSNAGHDYGNAQLTDQQRRELIEYLKTL